MRKIFLATENKGKIKEIKDALEGLNIEFLSPEDFSLLGKPVEDGSTFRQNAFIKSIYYFDKTGILTLADDSGLEVDYLGGKPGIFSARYSLMNQQSGDDNTDYQNCLKLLEELKGVPDEKRTARFKCVLSLYNGIIHNKIFEGICEGKITMQMRGECGFGYDPLFLPEGSHKTLAEISIKEKSKISHRGQALSRLREYLLKMFN